MGMSGSQALSPFDVKNVLTIGVWSRDRREGPRESDKSRNAGTPLRQQLGGCEGEQSRDERAHM